MKILTIILLISFSINAYAIDCSKEKPFTMEDSINDVISENYVFCLNSAFNCDKLNKREQCDLLTSINIHIDNVLDYQKNANKEQERFYVKDYYSILNPGKISCSALYQITADASKCLQMRELENKYSIIKTKGINR